MKHLRQYIRRILLEKIRPEDFEDVLQTANLAHLGQIRRDGTPYITHPMAVMQITKRYYPENLKAQILAVLHDVLEDGPREGLSETDLRQIIRGSITDPHDLLDIEEALEYMTHDKLKIPVYEDYLRHVFSNPLAAIVKVSDLIHNLSHNPSERQVAKYQSALANVSPPKSVRPEHLAKLQSTIGKHR